MTRARTDALEEVPPRAAGRDRHLLIPSRFTAAVVGAGFVVGLAAILVVLDGTLVASDLLPVLIGAAGVCLALIARRSAPGLAWMALILGSLVAASIPIGLSRAADPQLVGLGRWLVVAIRASAAAIATVAIAALYATRPERQLTARVSTLASFLVAWLAVACLVVVVLVIAGARADPDFNLVDIATTPTALFVHFVLLLAGLGVAGDLRAAAIRADGGLIGAGERGRADERPIAHRLRAIVRELIPGQADADAAALDAERARLAGDLHAVVLPLLRRAIAEAEAGFPIENLAERLRSVDLELERLMADRWPVILEAFGLVDALEDLAERTEDGSAVQVALEIDQSAGRPRPEVERAAWRVAQLALDNAVRHAAASQITIVIAVAPERVQLSIADDGRGFDPADPVRAGARGLADLGRQATAVGGRVTIEAGSAKGTVVRFEWPG